MKLVKCYVSLAREAGLLALLLHRCGDHRGAALMRRTRGLYMQCARDLRESV